ncbi:uncharacterized protein N7484_001076 [Penicillium longicatenatum]|uniref:uncharacterized protein n=1 Tax=Penicillium longicatenatum TaxID=1561947 RepID=UPI0025470EBF|nr:uncharacterized protein N7484_001076 [Penicillium longicatenatum]KAJ5657427.1 hypothetical protein N7484_001076 [Penicillium longicatenatum]
MASFCTSINASKEIRPRRIHEPGDPSTTREYTVVTVHGVRELFNPDAENTARLWAELPRHVECINLLSFRYSWETPKEGITLDNLRELAAVLLAQIRQECAELLHGTDKALSIAISCEKYINIAAATSLLVFFGTPHRLPDYRSWESLAGWLLLLSGQHRSYGISWISQTAQMIEGVITRFRDFQMIFKVMNVLPQNQSTNTSGPFDSSSPWQALDEGTGTLGVPNETTKHYDQPTTYSSDLESNPDLFTAIFKEINRSHANALFTKARARNT